MPQRLDGAAHFVDILTYPEQEQPNGTSKMNPRYWPIFVLPFFLSTSSMAQDQEIDGEFGADYVEISVSRLTCTIGNNRALDAHRAGYNGIFKMISPDQTETPYVPLYAGINLENFFDAAPRPKDRKIFFEPRNQPMSLKRINEKTVELHQAATPRYGIESHMRFQLKSPYYVDYKYTCIPRKSHLAGGFFGVFWASYIHVPHDKSFYYLGENADLKHPFWEQFLTQQHNRDSTLRSQKDPIELAFEDGPPALWTRVSPKRYSTPFYYGRFRNMVLIYIFKPNTAIRFAHSPTGGGQSQGANQRNPAWDFQLIVPDYQVDRPYDLEMRVVYKPWSGREDVLAEVEQYLVDSATN